VQALSAQPPAPRTHPAGTPVPFGTHVLILGLVHATLLTGRWHFGLVIAAAMLTNILIAGLAGVLVPLGLERAGADPAVASSVFVTMVTDSMGFLVFLGLATAAGLAG